MGEIMHAQNFHMFINPFESDVLQSVVLQSVGGGSSCYVDPRRYVAPQLFNEIESLALPTENIRWEDGDSADLSYGQSFDGYFGLTLVCRTFFF